MEGVGLLLLVLVLNDNNLTSVTGYFEQAVPRYLPYEFKDHFRMTTRTFQIRQSCLVLSAETNTWLVKQPRTYCN